MLRISRWVTWAVRANSGCWRATSAASNCSTCWETQSRFPNRAAAGKRVGAVKGFLKNVELAAGGLPLRSMPNWLWQIIGWLMPNGPRGLKFARACVEMNAMETVLHLRRQYPQRVKNAVPANIWALVKPYGIESEHDERP